MRKLLILCLSLLFAALAVESCTDNQRARTWGGEETIYLQDNEQFVNITWKQDNLWLIVQDTSTGEFYARESSSFGLMEGRVVIKYKSK